MNPLQLILANTFTRSSILSPVLVWMIFCVAVGCTDDNRRSTVGREDSKVFIDTFEEEDIGERWLVDGLGTVTTDNGRLRLTEDIEGVGMVLWTRQDIPDSVRYSFEIEFSENTCIGVFFLAGSNTDGSALESTRSERTGAYDEYIRGNINNYSLSLHRYWPDGRNNPGSNLRRNPGFHLLDQALPDPMLASNVEYKIRIDKLGDQLQVFVDGNLTHETIDTSSAGPYLAGGRFGIRLRGKTTCSMLIDNVIITRLPRSSAG